MNNPNPFIPQGSLLEQVNKKRARLKLAVYIIFGATILVISPLLIQGCKKEAPAGDTSGGTTPVDTNPPPTPPVDTNPPPALPPISNSAPLGVTSNVPPPPPPPAPPAPTTQEYVVAKGDSFFTIAKKFGVKIKEVEAANPGVTPTKLKVGQKLTIPASATGGGTSSEGMTSAPTETTSEYTVKNGDTLTRIAKEHGVSIKALREANDLKTDKIKVGQKLKVPEKAAPQVDTGTPPPTAPTPPPPSPAPTTTAPETGH